MLASLQKLRGRLFQHELIAHYSAWRVGGPADLIYIPADIDDLSSFLETLPFNEPLFWMGSGSHVLIRDKGIDGAVIITRGGLDRITMLQSHIVRAEAGVKCMELARYTAQMGLTGLEFMICIPGTVGGSLAKNTGCYGGETWKKIHCVETINRAGQIQLRSPSEFTVMNRHVKGHREEWFVAGHFLLSFGDKNRSLADIRSLLEKHHVFHPREAENCGALFHHPSNECATRLIESCDLKKMSKGGAYISPKNANFIINDGTATVSDIETLMMHVSQVVEEKQHVRLIPDIQFIGNQE